MGRQAPTIDLGGCNVQGLHCFSGDMNAVTTSSGSVITVGTKPLLSKFKAPTGTELMESSGSGPGRFATSWRLRACIHRDIAWSVLQTDENSRSLG